MKNKKEAYYSDYLQLDKILCAQELKSKTLKEPIHEELLFIIPHQAYELWFKQIIHEIDSIIDLFKESYIEENNLSITSLASSPLGSSSNTIIRNSNFSSNKFGEHIDVSLELQYEQRPNWFLLIINFLSSLS